MGVGVLSFSFPTETQLYTANPNPSATTTPGATVACNFDHYARVRRRSINHCDIVGCPWEDTATNTGDPSSLVWLAAQQR
jgi:hypothetical protein